MLFKAARDKRYHKHMHFLRCIEGVIGSENLKQAYMVTKVYRHNRAEEHGASSKSSNVGHSLS